MANSQYFPTKPEQLPSSGQNSAYFLMGNEGKALLLFLEMQLLTQNQIVTEAVDPIH